MPDPFRKLQFPDKSMNFMVSQNGIYLLIIKNHALNQTLLNFP